MIDTSPDLREQLIDADVDHIDAVFLTHEHADQTHGIDDLRSVVLHQRRRIPVYLNQSTAKDIMARFSYCFVSPTGSDYPPILRPAFDRGRRKPDHRGEGRRVTLSAFLVQHGNIPALGYRIGDAAYTPDVNDIPRESWPRAGKSRSLDHRRACATPAIPAISASTMRCPGSSASSRSRAVITNMHSDLDYEVLRQSAAGGRGPGL